MKIPLRDRAAVAAAALAPFAATLLLLQLRTSVRFAADLAAQAAAAPDDDGVNAGLAHGLGEALHQLYGIEQAVARCGAPPPWSGGRVAGRSRRRSRHGWSGGRLLGRAGTHRGRPSDEARPPDRRRPGGPAGPPSSAPRGCADVSPGTQRTAADGQRRSGSGGAAAGWVWTAAPPRSGTIRPLTSAAR